MADATDRSAPGGTAGAGAGPACSDYMDDFSEWRGRSGLSGGGLSCPRPHFASLVALLVLSSFSFLGRSASRGCWPPRSTDAGLDATGRPPARPPLPPPPFPSLHRRKESARWRETERAWDEAAAKGKVPSKEEWVKDHVARYERTNERTRSLF